MPDQQLTKTVLELDLASYAEIGRVLEENLDVTAVKAFEDQIQSFVDRGLESVSLSRADVVLGTAGDNAILIFDRAETMHDFARAVHEATVTHNLPKTVASARRWFRMGGATGTVLIIESERRIVGSTVARAVRLEAAAAKGELLIDLATYNALPESLKTSYGPEEIVPGKRGEAFKTRRCRMIAMADAATVGSLPALDTSASLGRTIAQGVTGQLERFSNDSVSRDWRSALRDEIFRALTSFTAEEALVLVAGRMRVARARLIEQIQQERSAHGRDPGSPQPDAEPGVTALRGIFAQMNALAIHNNERLVGILDDGLLVIDRFEASKRDPATALHRVVSLFDG